MVPSIININQPPIPKATMSRVPPFSLCFPVRCPTKAWKGLHNLLGPVLSLERGGFLGMLLNFSTCEDLNGFD